MSKSRLLCVIALLAVAVFGCSAPAEFSSLTAQVSAKDADGVPVYNIRGIFVSNDVLAVPAYLVNNVSNGVVYGANKNLKIIGATSPDPNSGVILLRVSPNAGDGSVVEPGETNDIELHSPVQIVSGVARVTDDARFRPSTSILERVLLNEGNLIVYEMNSTCINIADGNLVISENGEALGMTVQVIDGAGARRLYLIPSSMIVASNADIPDAKASMTKLVNVRWKDTPLSELGKSYFETLLAPTMVVESWEDLKVTLNTYTDAHGSLYKYQWPSGVLVFYDIDGAFIGYEEFSYDPDAWSFSDRWGIETESEVKDNVRSVQVRLDYF